MTKALCETGSGQVLRALGCAFAAAQIMASATSAHANIVRADCDLEVITSPPITAATAVADWQRFQDIRAQHGVPRSDFQPLPMRN
jgi:hypothetical protein